jgi:hypothetical protein
MPKASDDFIDSLLANPLKVTEVSAKNVEDKSTQPVEDEQNSSKEIKEEVKKDSEEVSDSNQENTEEKKDDALDTDSLKSQIEKLELRRKDSERSFNEANKEKLRLIKKVESMKSENDKLKESHDKMASAVDKKFGENFDSKYEEDPEGSVKEAVKMLLEKVPLMSKPQEIDMEEIMRKQRLIAEEAIMKKEYSDYDYVIDAFLSESNSNTDIVDKWNDSGQSVAKAYELGKPFFDAKEISKDPAAYKDKLRKEILAESKSEHGETPSVSSMNSTGTRPKKDGKGKADLATANAAMGSLGIKGF